MASRMFTFTGGGSGSRRSQKSARRAAKRKKLATKRGTIREAVRREILNTTTSGLLGIEKKFADVYYAADIVYNDPTTIGVPPAAYAELASNTLVPIAQGTAPYERIGHKLTLLSVYCRGEIIFPGANALDLGGVSTHVRNQHVFMALVLDKQANGARPAVGSIYNETLTGQYGEAGPLRNMANTARFRVLKQWDFYRNMDGIAQNAGSVDLPDVRKKWEWSMKLNIPYTYLNTTTSGNISDLTDNSLHLVAWYVDNGYQAAPRLAYAMRFRFTG